MYLYIVYSGDYLFDHCVNFSDKVPRVGQTSWVKLS